VAGDGEAASGFECSKGDAVITGDIDELERAVVVDDGHATVEEAGRDGH
jgi:hypothetical protein